MRRGPVLLGTITLAVMLLTSSAPVAEGNSRVGGMVDSLLWIEETNQTRALQDLDNGLLDIYMFPLRSADDIARAKSDPKLWTIDGAGGAFDLLLNPVPVNQAVAPGVANPFSKRAVREAMNYLIDREFITREIAGASMYPQVTLESRRTPEYARDPVFMYELERRYRFNETLASQMISNALAAEPDYRFDDATHRWQYKDHDIALNFVIRHEDLRKDIGNYIADQLERIGFLVNRMYCSAACVATIWVPPPDAGTWQLYTEGWAQTAITAWADSDPDFYSCGGEGHNLWSMYQPPASLNDTCTKLRAGRYTSLAERTALFERATEESLNDSVRVWLTAGTSTFVLSKRVTGLVYDLAGGPWGRLATRTARFDTPGGRLNLGLRLQYVAPWNPWNGFGWLYDVVQEYALSDPAVWPHPHTGLFMPIRATFSVDAPGPRASMAVPTDARTWDPVTLGFATVATGTTAKSSVAYRFTFGKWHDGSNFTMDDVLYELALAFRRADNRGDVYQKDADAADTATRALTTALRGFKVINANEIQVWYDYWNVDTSTIASVINPAFPAIPWTASELALSTVFDDSCRISEVTAGNEAKDPLDLTKGDCLTTMTANLPGYMTHLPPGLAFDPVEAASRWASLRDFNTTYGHFYVSNGPFILTKVDLTAVQTTMTLDPNYPIDARAYDAYLVPRVPQISFSPPPIVLIGRPATFPFHSRLPGDGAYDRINTTWLLVDPTSGEVLFDGTPAKSAAGSYEISLTGAQTMTLVPGTYELRTITVGDEAAVPVFASESFLSIPDICTAVAGSCEPVLCPSCLLNPIQESILDLQNRTAALQAQVRELEFLVVVSIASGAVALTLSASAMLWTVRTRNRGGRKSGEA